eukprot:Em0018g440a
MLPGFSCKCCCSKCHTSFTEGDRTISHFGLYWKMGMTTEISKDVSQMVVLSNDISTMSAGSSMITKRIKGNARAKGAQRTT